MKKKSDFTLYNLKNVLNIATSRKPPFSCCNANLPNWHFCEECRPATYCILSHPWKAWWQSLHKVYFLRVSTHIFPIIIIYWLIIISSWMCTWPLISQELWPLHKWNWMPPLLLKSMHWFCKNYLSRKCHAVHHRSGKHISGGGFSHTVNLKGVSTGKMLTDGQAFCWWYFSFF